MHKWRIVHPSGAVMLTAPPAMSAKGGRRLAIAVALARNAPVPGEVIHGLQDQDDAMPEGASLEFDGWKVEPEPERPAHEHHRAPPTTVRDQ